MPPRPPSVAMLLCISGALLTEAAFSERSWWPPAPVGIALLLALLFTADRFVATLPLRTSLTVADRLGWWPTAAVGAVAGGAVATIGQRRRGRGEPS